MANVSQEFMDNLGPLAALWAGRDQNLSENTSLINQQKGLEEISNSQQTRDIQRQKLPFELGQLEHQKKMNPLLLEKQGNENTEKKAKLEKDNFNQFFDDFKTQIPTLTGTPADAAVLSDIAKKNNLDPADPRIARMIQTGASGNQQAISDMITKIAQMSDKHIQDMTKSRFEEGQKNSRFEVEQAGLDRRAQLTAETQRYTADQRVAAVVARAKTVVQNTDQQIAQLEREMAAAPTQEAKQTFANRIKYLVDAKREISTAIQERRTEDAAEMIERLRSGGVFTPPESRLTTPPNSGGGSPAPKPAMSAQDQQAAAWAKANPNDPRAAAIMKRLGIQ